MRKLAILVILATLGSGCGYNQMVSMREHIDAAWAQVENQLQRRNDLIPNLVETTKGYATHEKEIFERIADARARMLAGGSREDKIDAANQMTSALGRLLAIAERYPISRRTSSSRACRTSSRARRTGSRSSGCATTTPSATTTRT
jgi:LemA protein